MTPEIPLTGAERAHVVEELARGLLDGLSDEAAERARESLGVVVDTWFERSEGDLAPALEFSAPMLRERVLAAPVELRERAIAAEAVGVRIELLSSRTLVIAESILRGEEPAGAVDEARRLEEQLAALSSEARALPEPLIAPWLEKLSEGAMEASFIIHRKATSLRLGHYSSASKKKSLKDSSLDWDALFSAEHVAEARALAGELARRLDDPDAAVELLREALDGGLPEEARLDHLRGAVALHQLVTVADETLALARQAASYGAADRPEPLGRQARALLLELELISERLTRLSEHVPDEALQLLANAQHEARFAMRSGSEPPRIR